MSERCPRCKAGNLVGRYCDGCGARYADPPVGPRQYDLGYINGESSMMADIQLLLEEKYDVPDGLSIYEGIEWLANRIELKND